MLVSQDFGNEVNVTVGNSEIKPVAIGYAIATVYVKKVTVPTITHLLRDQTKVSTTTNTYTLRATTVPVITVGDSYPIKKLTQYLNLAGLPVLKVNITDDSNINTEYKPDIEQNYIKDLTSDVFVTPSNTQVPVSYYNATGTFWSTG